MTTPYYSDRDPKSISTVMLTADNYDVTIGAVCNHCGLPIGTRRWRPFAVVKAPFAGGMDADRVEAVVRECPECFEISWCHADDLMVSITRFQIEERRKELEHNAGADALEKEV
jgi:hypothetical protein